MCYTSGTTGDPKGVLYSHRSNVLHALMANNGDALGTRAKRYNAAGGAAVPRQ
jgi:fatty-acyl-CoA synthase